MLVARTFTEGAFSMQTLEETIAEPEKRKAVIDDALRVLDAEVADKTGISGMAVKGAYKMVKGVRPGFVRQVVDHLLDDFLEALEPIHAEARAAGKSPSAHMRAERSRVAEALLAVTDARAEKADNKMIKKTYEKLRPTAQKHVEAAVPRLGEMVERHAQG